MTNADEQLQQDRPRYMGSEMKGAVYDESGTVTLEQYWRERKKDEK